MLLHGSRQVVSWLIFDVGRKHHQMRLLPFIGRAIILGAIVVIPAATHDLAIVPRLVLTAILLAVLVGAAARSTGSIYLSTVPGRLEFLGGILLVSVFCLTYLVAKKSGSETFGVAIGGAIGFVYLAAMIVSVAGLLSGAVVAVRRG